MTQPRSRPSRVSELENPFRIGGAVTGKQFTDRAEERRRIRRALTSPQAHLLVYGPRRMGKTSTLRVVRDELAREGKHVVMADLSTASTVVDMTNRILQTATAELGRRWRDVVTTLVQRLTVKVGLSPDPSGLMLPSIDVSVRDAGIDAQRSALAGALDAIEHLAAAKRTRIGVVLDEFQEIHRFGGEQAEAHLRGVIQHHKHVSYVLAGSDERLIHAMISARRPFYKLLEPLAFGPIDPEHLARWIDERLESSGVHSSGAGTRIVALAGPRTRDVVQLARGVFETGRRSGQATETEIEEAFRQVVLSEDAPIRSLWDSLSPLQQNVLRALAERSGGLTTKNVRRQYGLGDTGPATKAVQTLVRRDVLMKSASQYLYDSPFLRGWVIANTLPDVGLFLAITHLPSAADAAK
jgi:Cdc6-like AAA superfamily ATPase